MANVKDEPRPWLARLVRLGAQGVTAKVVGSSAWLASFACRALIFLTTSNEINRMIQLSHDVPILNECLRGIAKSVYLKHVPKVESLPERYNCPVFSFRNVEWAP